MTLGRFAVITLLASIAGCGVGSLDSPLIAAARKGDTGAIRSLIKNGANPNETGGVNGWTVLQHAVHKNQAAAVDTLLEDGADPNLAPRGNFTALMMAAGYGYENIVRTLLKHGADPRIRNAHGGTALDLAVNGITDIDRFSVGECNTPVVRLILEAAPDLTAQRDVLAKAARLVRGSAGCAEVARLIRAKH